MNSNLLRRKVADAFLHSDDAQYTLQSLFTLSGARDYLELIRILKLLIQEGKVQPVIRVMSPSHPNQGLKDFEHDKDVPHFMEDTAANKPEIFSVGQSDMLVIYKRAED